MNHFQNVLSGTLNSTYSLTSHRRENNSTNLRALASSCHSSADSYQDSTSVNSSMLTIDNKHVNQTLQLNYSKNIARERILFNCGIINTTDENSEQQVPNVTLTQFTTADNTGGENDGLISRQQLQFDAQSNRTLY